MNSFLYSIYDRLAGVYSEPFMANKDELAVRKFNYIMQNSPMVSKDCDLYKLGGFDSETGSLSVPDKPIFVIHSEVAVG